MRYDFDTVMNRKNTDSIKWDAKRHENILPMWVADMDFKTAEPVTEALKKKAGTGIFGYTLLSDNYYDAVIKWWNKRHNFTMNKEWILFCSGVVPAIGSIIRTLTEPGDKILIQSPVYNAFYSTITDNNREVISNDLICSNGKYGIDFGDLEQKASDPQVKLMLLCSPHNPVGRVWTKEELERVGEICIKNHVIIISDEIHCDLIYKGYEHIPFASLGETVMMNSITCTSPGKTFNLAGLNTSNIIIPDKELKDRVECGFKAEGLTHPNFFGTEALIAAYNHGEDWLDQLMVYLKENCMYLENFIKEELPELEVICPEATYLMWVDCRKTGISSKELCRKLMSEEKLWVVAGNAYGDNGEGYIRINIACPRDLLVEGLKRLKRVIEKI